MASEYKFRQAIDAHGNPFPALTPKASQTVTTSGTTARSTAIDSTAVVRVVATVACHIKFGDETVEATTSDPYLPAGVPEYFHMDGNTHIAAIQNAAGGVLHITVME